jgi:hypothetical protein
MHRLLDFIKRGSRFNLDVRKPLSGLVFDGSLIACSTDPAAST